MRKEKTLKEAREFIYDKYNDLMYDNTFSNNWQENVQKWGIYSQIVLDLKEIEHKFRVTFLEENIALISNKISKLNFVDSHVILSKMEKEELQNAIKEEKENLREVQETLNTLLETIYVDNEILGEK